MVEYEVKPAGKRYHIYKDGELAYTIDWKKRTCTCIGFLIHKKCKHIPMVERHVCASQGRKLRPEDEIRIDLSFHNVKREKFGFRCEDQMFGIFPEGIILDLETTGFSPNRDEIITFGYIQRGWMTILQRADEEVEEFYDAIVEELDRIPKPIYAFMAEFERRFLDVLGFKGTVVDILDPWKAKARELGMKTPKLDELVPGPEEWMGEEYTSGEDMPRLWRRYLQQGDIRDLKLIIRHNQIDLLQEFAALAMTALIR